MATKERFSVAIKRWTTDAYYRETRKKVIRRKSQGAICVEMECAGMQAACDFRGTDFFQFFSFTEIRSEYPVEKDLC